MITIEIHFETGLDARSVVESLRGLPVPVRPLYFAEDEGRIVKANVLSDERRFEDLLKRNSTLGFHLYSEDKKTSVYLQTWGLGDDFVSLDLEIEDHAKYVTDCIMCLLEHGPIYGFACDLEERYHRNYHIMKIAPWTFTHYIGRDLNKYIPGVYWYTLISDGLLERHRVSLADLSVEAISTETMGDGSLQLLRFFDQADEWQQNQQRLDDLCERVPGMFSRRAADDMFKEAKSYREHGDISDLWP